MSAVIYATDFDGYIPGREPRQCQKVTVLDGRNFYVDLQGPRAAFGDTFWLSSFFTIAMRQQVTELRCGDELFFGTPEGIYRIDNVSKLLYPLFDVAITNSSWPWSVAYVGKKYYFSQYSIGLWEYDPSIPSIRHVSTPVFDDIRWVCEVGGRLIAQSSQYTLWSAQDDGSDLTPCLATGAGAQGVSLVGGTPLRCDALANGVLVATDKGLMKGTLVDQVYVFVWKVVSRDLKLYSPSCACSVPDAGIIYLDAHGLRYVATTDSDPATVNLTPWEIEMSNALRRDYPVTTRIKYPGNVLLHYSYAEQCIYLAFSTNGANGQFAKAYVYYLSTGKWGIFNKTFTGLFDLDDGTGLWRLGYMSSRGSCRRMSENYYREEDVGSTDIDNLLYFKPAPSHISKRLVDTENVRSADPDSGEMELHLTQDVEYEVEEELWYSDFDPHFFSQNVVSGLYDKNEFLYSNQTPEVPSTLVASQVDDQGIFYEVIDEIWFSDVGFDWYQLKSHYFAQESMDSSILLGPLRVLKQQDAAELCQFDEIVAGVASLGDVAEITDWNNSSNPDEDWNNVEFELSEDWGTSAPNAYTFNAELTMSRDATVQSNNFTEKLMSVEETEFSTSYCPQQYVGLYGLLNFNASAPGQFFYLKTLEVGGQPCGYQY